MTIVLDYQPIQSPYCEPIMFQNAFLNTSITPAVRTIIIINIAVYIVQTLFDTLTGNVFTLFFGLNRIAFFHGYLWQVATYFFLHGNLLHLLLNMLGLYFMGPPTEERLGTRHFVILYCLSGLVGGLAWLLSGAYGFCIGASGAVFGVIGAFAILFPYEQLTLLVFFVLPVTMPAWLLAAGLATIDLIFFLTQPAANIAFVAHLGGMASGIAYCLITKKNPAWWYHFRRYFRQRPHLRIFKPEPDPKEVDHILDKLARDGIDKLTSKERETLTRASKSKQRDSRRH